MARFKSLSIRLLPTVLLLSGCSFFKPTQTQETKDAIDAIRASGAVGENDSSTFYVNRGSQGTPGTCTKRKEIPNWDMITSVFCTFNIQIMSTQARSPLVRQKFFVDLGDRKIDAWTEFDGWLSWNEIIDFNPLSKAVYLKWDRTIEGTGVNRGRFTVPFAVSPWGSFDDGEGFVPIVDLRAPLFDVETVGIVKKDDQFGNALFGLSQYRGSPHITKLFAENIKVQIVPTQFKDNRWAEMKVNVSLTPLFHREGFLQRKILRTPHRGKYRVHTYFIAESTYNDKPVREILNESVASVEVQTPGPLLQANLLTKVRQAFDGNVYLAIRVEPLDGPQGLGPLEAVYLMGDDFAQTGGSSAVVRDFDYGKPFTDFDTFWASIRGADNFTPNPDVRDVSRFLFDPLKGNFQNRVLTDATTDIVTVSVTACVKNPFTRRPMLNRNFAVKVFDENGKRVMRHGIDKFDYKNGQIVWNTKSYTTQNATGCVVFPDTVEFKYYQKERLIPRKYELTDVASGDKSEHVVFMHPWEVGWTLLNDSRVLDPDLTAEFRLTDAQKYQFINPDLAAGMQVRLSDLRRQSSRIVVTDYSYTTLDFRYEIDSFLNLFVKKMIQLRFLPHATRYNALAKPGRSTTAALRDGFYLLKTALHKNYYDPSSRGVVLEAQDPRAADEKRESVQVHNPLDTPPNTFLSVQKKLARVEAGRIVENIELTMNDLRLMRIRKNLLIQLEPVDERVLKLSRFLIEKGVGVGPVELIAKELAGKMSPQNLYNVLTQARTTHNEPKIGEILEKYAQNLDFILYSDPDSGGSKGGDPFDYDVVREPKEIAGLSRRTFIGPLILISNRDHASLRPTDDLEEANCNVPSCDQLTELAGSYEVSRQSVVSRIESELETKEDREKFGTGPSDLRFAQNPPDAAARRQFYLNIGEFKDVHVDQLIQDWRMLKREHTEENRFLSALPRYLHAFNSVFASPNDEPLTGYEVSEAFSEGCIQGPKTNGKIFCPKTETTMVTPWRKLVSELSESFQFAIQFIDKEDMKSPDLDSAHRIHTALLNLANSGDLQNVSLATALCVNLIENEISATYPAFGEYVKKTNDCRTSRATCVTGQKARDWFKQFHSQSVLSQPPNSDINELTIGPRLNDTMTRALDSIQDCIEAATVSISRPEDFRKKYYNQFPFVINHKLRVHKVSPARLSDTADNNDFKGGLQMNLTVNSNFGFNNQEQLSRGTTTTVKTNPWGALTTWNSFGRIVNNLLGLFDLSLNWGASTSVGRNSGVTITTSTYLVAQIASFDIGFEEYEPCTEIRLNPRFLDENLKFLDLLKDIGELGGTPRNAWPVEMKDYFSKGYFVCSGEIIKEKRKFPERFYYLTQHFTQGDMLDEANIMNHPWLLQLRGEKDFIRFVEATQGKGSKERDYVLLPKPQQRFIDDAADTPYRAVRWYLRSRDQLANSGDSNRLESFPLQHLIDVYNYVPPSFMGLYDVLHEDKRISDVFGPNSVYINGEGDKALLPTNQITK